MSADSLFPFRGYRLAHASWRDLLAVHRLERVIFPGDAYAYPELFLLLVWPRMINLKVIDGRGRLVGFVSGGPFPTGGRLWIMTLGIHPEHQRQGLAWRLLAACEVRIPMGPIFLTVRQSNERAYLLYLRNGYIDVRTKRGYYPDGEAGVEMRKDRI